MSRGYFTIFYNSIFRPSPIRVPHTAHAQKIPSTSSPILNPYLPSIYHPQSPLYPSPPSPFHPLQAYPSLPKSKKPRNFAINHNINIQSSKSSILKSTFKSIQIHSVNCLRSIPLSANFIPLIDSN